MKQISGKDLGRAVQRKGWSLARVHGSHHIFVMRGRRERIVIPVHGNRPLKIGLLRARAASSSGPKAFENGAGIACPHNPEVVVPGTSCPHPGKPSLMQPWLRALMKIAELTESDL